MSAAGSLVICGFGRVGAAAAKAGERSRNRHDISVIDCEHERCENARRKGYRSINGDAAMVKTLRVGGVGSATDIIICIDRPVALSVVQAAREVSSSARIQVAVSGPFGRQAVLDAGADDVLVLAGLAGELLARSVIE